MKRISLLNRINKFNTLVFLVGIAAAIGPKSQAYNDEPPPPQDGSGDSAFNEIRDKLETSIVSPQKYDGSFKQVVEGEMGTFCRKQIAYSVDWDATVDEASADIGDNGTASVNMTLGASILKVAVWRKGGILCEWMGGTANVFTRSTDILFDLIPDLKTGGYPSVDLKKIKIGGLQMTNFNLHIPILGNITGDAPEWANDFVEKKFNSIMENLVSASLKKRINSSLSKQLQKMLEQEKRNRGQNINKTPPMTSFSGPA